MPAYKANSRTFILRSSNSFNDGLLILFKSTNILFLFSLQCTMLLAIKGCKKEKIAQPSLN